MTKTTMTEAKRLRAGDFVQGENLGEWWVIGRIIAADKTNGSIKVEDNSGDQHILTKGETYKATRTEFENFVYEEDEPMEDETPDVDVKALNVAISKASEEGPKDEPTDDEPTDDEAPVEERESSAGRAWINNQQRPFYQPRLVRRGKNQGKLEIRYNKSATNNRKRIFIRVEDVIAWHVDSDPILNVPEPEEDGQVRIKPDWSRYTVQETKTASGRRVVNNGDEVAALLQGLLLDDAYGEVESRLASIEDESPNESELREKYKHLNEGMQRMNIGNRLRAAMRRNGIESLSELE